MGDADAYTVRSRAEQLLRGLGFTHEQMGQPVASFSGGWRMRLNLAQALMCPSDLLLLDEPTNHLDLDAIIWVEDWLKRYAGTLVIVSHDRDFLDGVVNVVVHIDPKKLKRYTGNYSSFERQRAAAVVLAAGMMEKQARERAHLESFIERFRAKASKAKQAQSRMKMLAKMEDLAPLHVSAPFSFEFREPLKAPDPLLVLENVDAGYHIDGHGQARGRRHQVRARERPALRPARHQRRGEIDADQDHRGRARAACRHREFQQGARRRLLRTAPGGDAARRRVAAVAPRAHRAAHPRAGAAQFSRRLQLPRRHGDRLDREFLGRRKGAARARHDRLAAAQPAAARRADQPPRPGDARGAHRGAGAVRRHAGAGVARPAPAARHHRPVPDRRRRQAAAVRRRPRRLPRLAVQGRSSARRTAQRRVRTHRWKRRSRHPRTNRPRQRHRGRRAKCRRNL